MSTPYLSEIRYFGFDFAPKGWALSAGQLLSIASNAALFSLLGTNYGGNGTTVFALPDLRGRVPLHWGNGAGLTPYVIGEELGNEAVTVTAAEMPLHNHTPAAALSPTSTDPTNHVWATADGPIYGTIPGTQRKAGVTGQMAGNALANTGGSQPHENRAPFLVVNACIALVGVFPTRN